MTDGGQEESGDQTQHGYFPPTKESNLSGIYCPKLDEEKAIVWVNYVNYCPMCGDEIEVKHER